MGVPHPQFTFATIESSGESGRLPAPAQAASGGRLCRLCGLVQPRQASLRARAWGGCAGVTRFRGWQAQRPASATV